MFKSKYLVASSLTWAVLCGLSTTTALADETRHGVSDKEKVQTQEVQAPTAVQAAAAPVNPAIVGLVKSYEGNNLLLRLSDGSDRSYPIEPTATGSDRIRQGAFVSLDMDPQGQIKTVDTAEVDRVYEGTISKIEAEQVTVDLEDGTTYTTIISPATVARMGLESGSPLKVTTYKGTTATLLCLGQKATPIAAPIPIAPPPEPVGGGELTPVPALPPQPRALW